MVKHILKIAILKNQNYTTFNDGSTQQTCFPKLKNFSPLTVTVRNMTGTRYQVNLQSSYPLQKGCLNGFK